MLTAQIGFEANNINLVLGQLKSARRSRARNALLDQGLQAAKRALEQLREEPLITRTAEYVTETLARHDFNPWAVSEELRVDRDTIRWFVKAECNLLRAAGFAADLVESIEQDMLAVLSGPLGDPTSSLEEKFQQLADRVDQNLRRLYQEGEHSEAYRTLAAVLGVLGGCAAVAADTAAAAATTGVAAPLLGLSVPLGASIIDQALSEFLDD
jgi:hypothetical protein